MLYNYWDDKIRIKAVLQRENDKFSLEYVKFEIQSGYLRNYVKKVLDTSAAYIMSQNWLQKCVSCQCADVT